MRSDEWPLTGRSRDQAQAIDAVRDTGGVLLAGTAGVGKTRLARELLADTARRGCPTRWVAATVSSRAVPLGAFAGLLAEAGGVTEARLLGRLVTVLGSGTHTLAVDDAHLLDDGSATLLHHLAVQRAARLVVTLRSGEPAPDAVTALWKDGLVERLDLASLGEQDIGTLVEAALGGPVEVTSRHRLFQVTQGNVLLLRHLVDGERRAGRLAPTGGLWRWIGEPRMSPALADLIDARIGRLSESLRRLLELVAFGEPLGIDLLMTLADRSDVEEAAERGLVIVEPSGRRLEVRLGHPLFGEALRSRSGALRARRRRGQLATALAATGGRRTGDRLRQAVLALDSDLAVDPVMLTESGAAAAALADMPLAVRLFQAARDAGGGFEPQLGLGFTLSWVFRVEEADVELARAVELAETDEQRVRATLPRCGHVFFLLGQPGRAEALLRESAALTPDDVAVRAGLDGIRSVFAVAGDRLDESATLARRALTTPGASPQATLWAGWGLLGALGLSGLTDELAEPADRAMAAAVRAPETAAYQLNLTYWQVFGFGLAGRLDLARERSQWLREVPGMFAALFRGICDGRIALEGGQVTTAARLLGAARPYLPGFGGGWTTPIEVAHARSLAMAGDVPAAREALDRAAEFRHPGVRFVEPELTLAGAWLAAAEGASGHATEQALHAAELALRSGQWAVEVLSRHTAVCFGDRTQATRLGALAERVDGPRAPAAAVHARALAEHDPDGLLSVSARLERCGLLLPAVDAAAQAATLLAEQAQTTRRAVASARAAELAARCEGAGTPALRSATTPLRISAREREVAMLAAAGLSNRQIAARLHVSVRTVEGHVYRACTRLGVSDRAALAAAVAGEPAGGPARAR